jgi:hypothetical protein
MREVLPNGVGGGLLAITAIAITPEAFLAFRFEAPTGRRENLSSTYWCSQGEIRWPT